MRNWESDNVWLGVPRKMGSSLFSLTSWFQSTNHLVPEKGGSWGLERKVVQTIITIYCFKYKFLLTDHIQVTCVNI